MTAAANERIRPIDAMALAWNEFVRGEVYKCAVGVANWQRNERGLLEGGPEARALSAKMFDAFEAGYRAAEVK